MAVTGPDDGNLLRIAFRLCKETTMTLARVARRLRMGPKAHLAHLLYWHDKGKNLPLWPLDPVRGSPNLRCLAICIGNHDSGSCFPKDLFPESRRRWGRPCRWLRKWRFHPAPSL